MDFSPIADTFRGPVPQNDVGSTGAADTAKSICPCYACSPRSFDGDAELIRHGVDSDGWICGEGTPATSTPGAPAASTSTTTDATSSTTAASQPGNNAPPPSQPRKNAPPSTPRYNPPHTRAYIHHLLHTHEMSAHALLVSHNLAVVEAFLRGIRGGFVEPFPVYFGCFLRLGVVDLCNLDLDLHVFWFEQRHLLLPSFRKHPSPNYDQRRRSSSEIREGSRKVLPDVQTAGLTSRGSEGAV
ncbi:hypothetical protein CC2G_006619 [Coprinopsis cinerea AmutBmut pab1-1]|nr:hypothetical protein CC2G_006619 [Coprinopsis cinerea AmutBmut pab1-1]